MQDTLAGRRGKGRRERHEREEIKENGFTRKADGKGVEGAEGKECMQVKRDDTIGK